MRFLPIFCALPICYTVPILVSRRFPDFKLGSLSYSLCFGWLIRRIQSIRLGFNTHVFHYLWILVIQTRAHGGYRTSGLIPLFRIVVWFRPVIRGVVGVLSSSDNE